MRTQLERDLRRAAVVVETRQARERSVRQRRRVLACNEAVRVRRVANHQHLQSGEETLK